MTPQRAIDKPERIAAGGIPHGDDRAAFLAAARDAARRMSGDAELAALARELLIRSDRYDYTYQWTWLGVPIIQLPQDVVATQEAIWTARPSVIVETGVARGGSLILYASILALLGEGRVIGVDIDIRPHNRDTIERHPLAPRIELIEGSSIDPDTVAEVRRRLRPDDRVMVILDSNHAHAHVLAELRACAPWVSVGQYLIVADTVVEDIPAQSHRPRPWGPGDNPATALREFLAECDDFERDQTICDKLLLSSQPGGYLRRVASCE